MVATRLGTGTPVPSRRPVVSRICAGHLTVRRHRHQRLVDDAPSQADDRQHLVAWAWLYRRSRAHRTTISAATRGSAVLGQLPGLPRPRALYRVRWDRAQAVGLE